MGDGIAEWQEKSNLGVKNVFPDWDPEHVSFHRKALHADDADSSIRKKKGVGGGGMPVSSFRFRVRRIE